MLANLCTGHFSDERIPIRFRHVQSVHDAGVLYCGHCSDERLRPLHNGLPYSNIGCKTAWYIPVMVLAGRVYYKRLSIPTRSVSSIDMVTASERSVQSYA